MKHTLRISLLCASLLLAPYRLAAQFDAVTALFKEVHSISLYGQSGWVDGLDPDGRSNCLFEGVLCGVGTEVLIDIGGARLSHVELGLGASYLGGITANIPGLELRGAIRSFPTVSAYYSKELTTVRNFTLERYVGASLGVADLFNTVTYDSAGTEREVKGTTFEYGVTGGLYADIYGVGVFLEGTYRWRRFPSLDYTLVTADAGRIPASWPQHLNLSGPVAAVGLQFRLKANPPATTVQVWMLAEVDARELPAVVAATASASSVSQTQIVFGSLTLTAKDSSYVLQVVSRRADVNAAGALQSLLPPTVTEERGRYSVAGGQLTLDPGNPDRALGVYTITQIGDELIIRDSQNDYVLTFRKPGAGAATGGGDSKKE